MTFSVKGMMAEPFRYKRDQNNCMLDWKEYDIVMVARHTKDLGCKTPDQNINATICTSKEEMKQARLGLRNQAVHIPPCRQIERIDIQYGESRDQWIPPAVKGKNSFL